MAPMVPRCLPACVLVSHGCRPRRIRARACLPEGFGTLAQAAPSPYALLVENAPQRTQKRICAGGCVAAGTCPRLTIASVVSDCFGPGQRSYAMPLVMSGRTDIRRQVVHRQKPDECTQSCAPSMRTWAPSAALGGRRMRSAGIGGNACVTLAIVLTTHLDLTRSASRSASWAGVGCGCIRTASFAAASASPLSRASSLSPGSSTVSGLTWALTLRTVVRLRHPASPSTSLRMPA